MGVATAILPAAAAYAQTVQQTFQLQQGWNAVFVEVDPDPSDLDILFDGLDVRSVWMRDESATRAATSSCAVNEASLGCLPSTQTGWRVWFPPGQPQRAIQTLTSLKGSSAYLVHSGETAEWTVSGRPSGLPIRWQKGFSLGGFHVVEDTDAASTFDEYLSPSSAFVHGSIFGVNADGTLSRVADPRSERIASGRGFWVQAAQNTVYDGPISIDAQALRGIQLPPGTGLQFVRFENLDGLQRSVIISDSANLQVAETSDASAGRTPLKWYDYGDGTSPQWRRLDHVQVALESNGDPGAAWTFRIGVDRSALRSTGTGPKGELNRVLTISDGYGYRRWVGVTTAGDTQDGLWIGDVTVSAIKSLTDLDTEPTPTSSPFVFRVILHKSGAVYRLLREVVLVYRDSDGEYLLVTPSCPQLLEADEILPRVSTANFSFAGDLPMAGGFESSLTASILQGPVDPLNPFLHPFNPIHEEGFEATRNISLTFDPDGAGDPEWGVTRLAGTYDETVLGLHRNQIEARGRFELRRVSPVDTLCGP